MLKGRDKPITKLPNTEDKISTTDIVASDIRHIPKNQVKKSHFLLMSPQNLSSKEQDMLLLFVSKVNGEHYALPTLQPGTPQSEQDKNIEVPTFTFGGDVLEDWFDISKKQMASSLAPVAERLSKSLFGYKENAYSDSPEFKYRPLFSEISYRKATLKFIPNPLMWRMIIDYSKGFALIRHKTFKTLNSEYGKQLYQLLSRWKEEHNPLKEMPIYSLQELFGVFDPKGKPIKSSLAKPNTFIKRVVEKGIQSISESTEARKELIFLHDDENDTFGYRVTRSGRGGKYTDIKFLYYWVEDKANNSMTDKEANKIINDLDMVKRLSHGEELTRDECKLLYAAYKHLNLDDRAEKVLEGIKRRQRQENNQPLIIDAPSQVSLDLESKLQALEQNTDLNDY